VLPFYSALLQGAIEAKVPVQPIAIRYHDKLGQLSAIPEYCDETGLGTSMWRVAYADGLAVTVYLLPAIDDAAHERRSLATALRERIILCLQNPSVSPDAMTQTFHLDKNT
jgi:1-acyl-sn-glycerol-3-phosphate acyltransferase